MPNKEVWVLGTGESLYHYRNKIKKLKDRTILGLHRFFPYCKEYFDLYPTYWVLYDIYAAAEGLDYLIKLWKEKKEKVPTTIIMPEFCLTKNRIKMMSYMRPSWTPKKINELQYLQDEYFDKISFLLDNDIIKIETFKAETARRLEVRKIDVSSIDYHQRFFSDTLYLGSGKTNRTRRKNQKVENKLSYIMLPLVVKMGFNKVYMAGFDGIGGRFHDLPHIVDAAHNFEYMEKWVEWFKKLNIEMYNVVENKYTVLNEHVDYIPIETLI